MVGTIRSLNEVEADAERITLGWASLLSPERDGVALLPLSVTRSRTLGIRTRIRPAARVKAG